MHFKNFDRDINDKYRIIVLIVIIFAISFSNFYLIKFKDLTITDQFTFFKSMDSVPFFINLIEGKLNENLYTFMKVDQFLIL